MKPLGWAVAGGVVLAGIVGLVFYEKKKTAAIPAGPTTPSAPAPASTTPSSTATTAPSTPTAPAPAPTTPAPATPTTPTNVIPPAPATVVAPPTLTRVESGAFTQGVSYVYAMFVPAGGPSNAAAAESYLASASGISSPQVLWFGPTGEIDHTGGVVDLAPLASYKIPGMLIFAGTFLGPTGTTIPAEMTVWRVG